MNIRSFAKRILPTDLRPFVPSRAALCATLACFAGQALAADSGAATADMLSLLWKSLVFLAIMALVFGVALALAAKKFFVKTDPRVDEIVECLAHAHCGACGFAGCEQYAVAVLNDPGVAPNLCTPGGMSCTERVAELTGKVATEKEPEYARIMCQGSTDKTTRKFTYTGVKDCRAAVLAAGGDKTCSFGCLGYGTCVRACPFDAMSMGKDGLPVVDIKKCTGCKKCAIACPKKVIEVLPVSAKVIVACHSTDKGGVTRKYCTVGCTGCMKCVKVCPVTPVKAPKVGNNLSRINKDLCTACGNCVRDCPTKSIVSFVPLPPPAVQEEKAATPAPAAV
jgi:Na+-translocating ferredoxin:NAD+ oxidoreductase subunit B